MHSLEIKAKVKPGKENELNQVIKDLIPHFKSLPDFETLVNFNEESGEIILRLSNGKSLIEVKELLNTEQFILFLGSIKVLCTDYTLEFPKHASKVIY